MHPICPNSLEHCIRHTGTSIHVFSFWIITFFQFLKAWRSPYKWNLLTHCVHLELYKLIMYRCIFELFGRQNLHYFTNVGVIYYCLQNFAWTHQTIINLMHVLSGLLILFICQDRVRVQTKACQLSAWPNGSKVRHIFIHPAAKFGGR